MILILLSIFLSLSESLKYPIVFTTVRYINLASPTILQDIGVESNTNPYNIISLDGWSSHNPLIGPIQFWSNPLQYISNSKYGASNQEIQINLKLEFGNKKTKLLVHVSDNFSPFSIHLNPTTAAQNLSDFVINNNLDGVCIELIERSGLADITNSQWILNFTKSLRTRLKTRIISYQQFPTDFVSGMAFNSITPQLSKIIDFVVIKYYNFQLPDYSNYSSIFIQSNLYPGSTVKNLIELGLLPNQIVVGKPSSAADSYAQNFFVTSQILSASFVQAFNELGWYAGYAGNYYYYDKNGTFARSTIGLLQQLCDMSETCI